MWLTYRFLIYYLTNRIFLEMIFQIIWPELSWEKTFPEKSNDTNFPKIQKSVSAASSTILKIFWYGKTQRTLMISSRYLADQ